MRSGSHFATVPPHREVNAQCRCIFSSNFSEAGKDLTFRLSPERPIAAKAENMTDWTGFGMNIAVPYL